MRRESNTGEQVASYPLSMAESGRCVRIQRIMGGHGLQRRLSDMGLVPGMEIEVISTDRGGPVVVRIMESRFMIGRGMAHHIEVH